MVWHQLIWLISGKWCGLWNYVYWMIAYCSETTKNVLQMSKVLGNSVCASCFDRYLIENWHAEASPECSCRIWWRLIELIAAKSFICVVSQDNGVMLCLSVTDGSCIHAQLGTVRSAERWKVFTVWRQCVRRIYWTGEVPKCSSDLL